MVIAYVGAGGKTSLLHREAEACRAKGLKVFITTSTRMYIEPDTLLTGDAQAIIRRMEDTGCAMAGLPCGEKIAPLPADVYREVCRHADVVLIEADGSKHMPLKFPAAHEPVIYDNVDRIVIVCGLHALGRAMKDVCHRPELVKACLGIEDDAVITMEHIRTLAEKGYLLPLKEKFPKAEITVQYHDPGYSKIP